MSDQKVVHIRNSSSVMIDPATTTSTTAKEEKQFQQDTHWQVRLPDSGTIKAEENGKIVILTDLIVTCSDTAVIQVREKDAVGAQLLTMYIASNTCGIISFREGLEGAAYDGSNGGDLYWEVSSGVNTRCTATGYMRDA